MFTNRLQAGRQLAEKLIKEGVVNFENNLLVLAVPRGGVVIGRQLASKLKCPLDIIVTRKIGAPGHLELAIGAVGETNGSNYLNEPLKNDLGVSLQYLEGEIRKQREEIKRREKLYRQNKKPLNLENKIVIITDDGAATGATLISACREVWNNKPKKVIVALPVAPEDTVQKLKKEADEVIVLSSPEPFFSISQFYKDFPQLSDEEVLKILNIKD
jgi:putative phosphoribosyl transferase